MTSSAFDIVSRRLFPFEVVNQSVISILVSCRLGSSRSFGSTVLVLLFLSASLHVTSGNKHLIPVEPEPSFLEPLENVTTSQGREVQFTCVVNNLNTYKVAWIRPNTREVLALHNKVVAANKFRLAVSHNGHDTWKLYIKDVQRTDSGPYMCQLNTDPLIHQIGYLDVTISPNILDDDPPDGYMVMEGDSITLRCRATGVPDPKVEWKREDNKNIVLRYTNPNGVMQKTERLIHPGENLILHKIERQEMGVFLCIASNNVPPTVSKRFKVQVIFKPKVTATAEYIGVPRGRDVTIQCSVESPRNMNNNWFKYTGRNISLPGEKLINSSKYYIEEIRTSDYTLLMKLVIRNVAREDFTDYICYCENTIGKHEARIKIRETHVDIPKTTTSSTTTSTTLRTTTPHPHHRHHGKDATGIHNKELNKHILKDLKKPKPTVKDQLNEPLDTIVLPSDVSWLDYSTFKTNNYYDISKPSGINKNYVVKGTPARGGATCTRCDVLSSMLLMFLFCLCHLLVCRRLFV
uniref:Neurotrimin n=1 Tax=Cacopsylla melanoneura TaxID=428564 RepID=A0A8D8X7W4_9HEMI